MSPVNPLSVSPCGPQPRLGGQPHAAGVAAVQVPERLHPAAHHRRRVGLRALRSEDGVRLARKMQVGPSIAVGVQQCCKRLQLARRLGQLGVCLTCSPSRAKAPMCRRSLASTVAQRPPISSRAATPAAASAAQSSWTASSPSHPTSGGVPRRCGSSRSQAARLSPPVLYTPHTPPRASRELWPAATPASPSASPPAAELARPRAELSARPRPSSCCAPHLGVMTQ